MGFAIARILKICFANIGEVIDRIEVKVGMCITNMHTNISTTGFVKILLHCGNIQKQGRSNGLKGGGTPKFRLAPSALAWILPGIFQPKYLV